MSKSIKIVLAVIAFLAIAVALYVVQPGSTAPHQEENTVSASKKPITVEEQKKLLEQLAKPVDIKTITASGTVIMTKPKVLTIEEQVKLLEQLAKPVDVKTLTASGTVIMTKPKVLTIEEQVKLLEQLKTR